MGERKELLKDYVEDLIHDCREATSTDVEVDRKVLENVLIYTAEKLGLPADIQYYDTVVVINLEKDRGNPDWLKKGMVGRVDHDYRADDVGVRVLFKDDPSEEPYSHYMLKTELRRVIEW